MYPICPGHAYVNSPSPALAFPCLPSHTLVFLHHAPKSILDGYISVQTITAGSLDVYTIHPGHVGMRKHCVNDLRQHKQTGNLSRFLTACIVCTIRPGHVHVDSPSLTFPYSCLHVSANNAESLDVYTLHPGHVTMRKRCVNDLDQHKQTWNLSRFLTACIVCTIRPGHVHVDSP